MAISIQNIKMTAETFVSKLKGYINKTLGSEALPTEKLITSDETIEKESDKRVYKHSIPQTINIAESLNNKKYESLRKDIINTISNKIVLTNPATGKSKSSSIKFKELLESVPRQAVEVSGVVSDNKTDSDFIKMKALAFVSKIGPKMSNKNRFIDLSEEDILNPNSVLWGLKIGVSTKEEVLSSLNKYSYLKYDINTVSSFIEYVELNLTVFFDNKNILREIEVNNLFKGKINKFLKIGDPIDQAIKLLDSPIKIDEKIMSWNDISIFYSMGRISKIKIFTNNVNLEFENNISVEKFIVYTQGYLLGIILEGSTNKSIIINGNNKEYIINFMKDYSNIKLNETQDLTIDYEDIGIRFMFNDENTLIAIGLTDNFLGKTLAGLKIGDSVNKAIQIYGEPQEKDENYLMWDNIQIIEQENIVKALVVHC